MKPQGLLIATVILAALAGTLYWSNHHKAKEPAATAFTESPKILSLKDGDISQIAIKKRDSEPVTLVKNNGKWQITVPQKYDADQDAVSSLVSSASSVDSDRVVAQDGQNLQQYGLSQPALELDLSESGNKTHKLLLGDDTPTGSAVFATVEGDPRVFTVATYTKTSIDKGLNDLRDKRLLTVDFDKVTQIDLAAKKQNIEFGRNKQSWQIVKPRPLRTDSFQVDELTNKLRDAKMDLSAGFDEKKAAVAFASGTLVGSVKVTDASGTQELQVHKNKDDYYAKASIVAGIYKVPSDLGQALDKSVDDFRNKKLFDFGYDDPNKIELHDGAKAYLLTKGGQDWWSDGKKMDADTVSTLIDRLRDLSESKFVDSGFTAPLLDITVTSNDNKRVEKVLISKSGDNYIAKREGEPSLYEITSSSIDDVRKAAAAVRPAAPAPPPPAAKPSAK